MVIIKLEIEDLTIYRKPYTTQIKILPFPGLAQSDSEQPGPRATLLGCRKYIYHCCCNTMAVESKENEVREHIPVPYDNL